MNKKKTYVPISCVFYDLIEHFATLKQKVEIIVKYKDEEKLFKTKILDTIIREKVEYILIESPRIEIRMDNIISINGEKLSDYSNC